MPHNIVLTVRRVKLNGIFIETKTIKMSKKLTLDDLIIEEQPGGQNCRSCPLFIESAYDCMINTGDVTGVHQDTCYTHTITLKQTTDEQL